MAKNRSSWIDSWHIELTTVLVGLVMGSLGNCHFSDFFEALLTDDRSAVYGAVTGLQGALLGFVLAALTIVLGYSRSPELQLLRDSKQLKTLLIVYVAGIRSHAASTTAALLALLTTPGPLLGPLAAWTVATTCTLAFFRLFRTLWATRAVVLHVASASPRAPGQR